MKLPRFTTIRGWIRSSFLTYVVRMGCDFRHVPPRSIILFPVQSATLFCGLAGILSIKGDGEAELPTPEELQNLLGRIQAGGLAALSSHVIDRDGYLGGSETLGRLEQLVSQCAGREAFLTLVKHPEALKTLREASACLAEIVRSEERLLDRRASDFSTDRTERCNEALTKLRDASWALERDLLGALARTKELLEVLETEPGDDAIENLRWIDLLLSSLDRIEVRGRDSAGMEIVLEIAEPLKDVLTDLAARGLSGEAARRSRPGDLREDSLFIGPAAGNTASTMVSLVYKTASTAGRLGENTGYLREALRSDPVLRRVLNKKALSRAFMAHTRWASVGSITMENCHPVNNFVPETNDGADVPVRTVPRYGRGPWTIDVVLNGDVDNYRELLESFREQGKGDIDRRVTTDTKIIPLRIEQYLDGGDDLEEAFRKAVGDFEGSQAIAMQSNLEPGKVFLALRGSGQSLYVGICDDCWFYASEIYGFVERASRFIKMDGERERVPGDPRTRGQVVILDGPGGTMRGWSYDGAALDLGGAAVKRTEITTRDIDRRGHPHFLLKEILDAPDSIRKTLRGKYRIDGDCEGNPLVTFNLGDDVISPRLRQALARGGLKNVYVAGQGTAAVAGEAIAGAFRSCLEGSDIAVRALPATELSGFHLRDSLEDTLVIAVTQSGTTADTNRAVAMARERKAHLLAVVNRRQSDITNQVEGVFYTSDGRDIEMSVASTKAFYSQVTAGSVLAVFTGHTTGVLDDAAAARMLLGLERCPDLMASVINRREMIGRTAEEPAKRKRYWGVVGSGPNKVAADEVRIKLSELCYKTVSSDYVEDKKHIDLSSEPLVLVMAAGNPEPVVADIVKDVAIFKAHAAEVVVIADEGESRFRGIADGVLYLPHAAGYPGAVILNTLAGHLWGYYAARAIDAEASPLRAFRSALTARVAHLDGAGLDLFEQTADDEIHRIIEDFSALFRERRRRGWYGSLSADTAADLALLLKYATGKLPVEEFRADFADRLLSPSPLDLLDMTMGKAVDELARPIDAIRHQAKTVTVGTSRREDFPDGPLFNLLSTLGFVPENLAARTVPALRKIQGALQAVRGYLLYRVRGLDFEGKPGASSSLVIVARGGVALSMPSRVEQDSRLRGTKKTIVSTGGVYAGRGKSDNAPLVIVPLLGKEPLVESLLLVHVDFHDSLPLERKKDILGEKYEWIQDHVSEYNIPWNDDMIASLPPAVLLGESAEAIADAIAGIVAGKES